MSQAAKRAIVSFQREQGFGRVAIDGVGEMPFDAVVALAKPEDLTPGAKVNVVGCRAFRGAEGHGTVARGHLGRAET